MRPTSRPNHSGLHLARGGKARLGLRLNNQPTLRVPTRDKVFCMVDRLCQLGVRRNRGVGNQHLKALDKTSGFAEQSTSDNPTPGFGALLDKLALKSYRQR